MGCSSQRVQSVEIGLGVTIRSTSRSALPTVGTLPSARAALENYGNFCEHSRKDVLPLKRGDKLHTRDLVVT